MNIVYAANDAYAQHMGVSMYSLMDRNQDVSQLQVYVLSLGLSDASRDKLRQIAAGFGRTLQMIEVDRLEERLDCAVDTGGFDISILLRLFMGELLPETVERVLYLDCDTVIVRPLRRLWAASLDGCMMGAVMEPTIYPQVKESIGLTDADPYYNSGVLLVDLKRWRRENVQQQLMDFLKKKNGKLFASDQDLLNGTLKGKIKTLPVRYNFFTNYRYFSYGTLVRHAHTYKAVSKREFAQAKRHPVIIHYMGDERPWIAGNRNYYRLAYERCLAQTPWAGTPKTKGKEWYMLAYHMLDYVTAICPPVRWMISRRLGMRLVESRKK